MAKVDQTPNETPEPDTDLALAIATLKRRIEFLTMLNDMLDIEEGGDG
ncbi:hypothetical protein LCGC14_2903960 [marine sediment metagenome]|uniref:Uncharacterized protein n=1 Tax=marine sediment metagenome TaxID=412755 RepID=A0A0F8YFI5_9ZZZZ